MRDTTAEGRLFIALAAAFIGLGFAVVGSAIDVADVTAQFLSPRRWVLLAMGFALNCLALAIMRRHLEARAGAVLAVYAVAIFWTLVAGVRFMQQQLPVAFWVGNLLAMAVCYAVVAVRSRRRRLEQPDVQSSFLASRLSK